MLALTTPVTAAHDSHDAVNNVLTAKGANVAGDASRVTEHLRSEQHGCRYHHHATDERAAFAELTNLRRRQGRRVNISPVCGLRHLPQHDGTLLEGDVSTGAEINAVDENGNPVCTHGEGQQPELTDVKGLDSGNPVSGGKCDGSTGHAGFMARTTAFRSSTCVARDYNDPMWNQLLDESPRTIASFVGHSGYGSNFVHPLKAVQHRCRYRSWSIYGGTGMSVLCSPVVMAQTGNP